MDLPNRSDLLAVGRRYLRAAPNPRLSVDLVDVPGSDLNLIVGAASLMGEAVVAAFAKCVRGMFLDTADEDQLDRWVGDFLSMAREAETQASVDLLLTRPTFLAGGGVVAAGSRVATADQTAFALDVDVTFGATDLQKPATATALVAGPESNVPAGAIVSFLDQPFDASIVPSNAAPAAGGAAAETDAQLRGRARGFFRTIRRGVLGAIEQAAREVAGVAIATAEEVENPGTGLPAGAVQLVIGDVNGNATLDMIQAVKNNLLEFRTGGIPVFVTSGIVVFEPVVWLLEFQTGVDTIAAREDVRAVTVAMSQFLNPGAPLRRSDLVAAAKTVPGVILPAGALVAPAGDVFPVDFAHAIRVRDIDVSFL